MRPRIAFDARACLFQHNQARSLALLLFKECAHRALVGRWLE